MNIIINIFNFQHNNIIQNEQNAHLKKRGGGGVQAFHFGKNDFELGVGGEGQDTSRNFEGSFGFIYAILPT